MNMKIDLTKMYKSYYTAPLKPQLVDLEEAYYLSISGKGDPEGSDFRFATEALYKLSYIIKAICKNQANDFTVAKLEGLWWVDSDLPALEVLLDQWLWKLLIRRPVFVTTALIEEARGHALTKNKDQLRLQKVTFEAIQEGTSVQMMHVGLYKTEPETLEQMHAFMEAHELVQCGLHHEIYLSDPRKVNPSVMKTILRLPVKKRV